MNPARCGNRNAVTPPRWQVLSYDEVGSTMDEAALLAEQGAPSGTVVVARHQTAGRGRAGRSWTAPPGAALQMTAILRLDCPADALSVMPLLVGVAVARAIETLAPTLRYQLKWPNDVYLSGRKVAGILLVSSRTTLLVGIGVNVAGDREDLPSGATSLAAELAAQGAVLAGRLSVNDLLPHVLRELGSVIVRFLAGESAPDLDEWSARALFLNEPVQVVDAGRTLKGTFIGVDPDGALLLRGLDGEIIRVVAGDLTRGPQPVS